MASGGDIRLDRRVPARHRHGDATRLRDHFIDADSRSTATLCCFSFCHISSLMPALSSVSAAFGCSRSSSSSIGNACTYIASRCQPNTNGWFTTVTLVPTGIWSYSCGDVFGIESGCSRGSSACRRRRACWCREPDSSASPASSCTHRADCPGLAAREPATDRRSPCAPCAPTPAASRSDSFACW